MNAPATTNPADIFAGVRGVIVDLDGTMVHTAPDFHVAINRMRSDLSLAPVDIDTVVNSIGKGSETLLHNMLALDFDKQGIARHFDFALGRYQAHYLDINGDNATVYQDVHAGLEAMRNKGLRLACVTNKPVAFAVALLEKTGLQDYFEITYGGDSLPRKKPDPLPMLTVCQDFGLEPQQMVAIGDSINDSQAARAAGCLVISVPYGYNHGQAIQAADTDGIVTTLLEAANLLPSA